MKAVGLLSGAVVVMFALASCITVEVAPVEETSISTHPAPTEASTTTDGLRRRFTTSEESFIRTVRDESARQPVNWVDSTPDENLLNIAYLVCGSFDEGLAAEGVLTATLNAIKGQGWGEDVHIQMVGWVVAASVDHFCPEYMGEIDEFADS